MRHPLTLRSLDTLQAKDFAAYRDEQLQAFSGTTLRLELTLLSHRYTVAVQAWSMPPTHELKDVRKPSANQPRECRLENDIMREFDAKGNRIGTKWAVDAAEADIVRQMFAMRESGQSMPQIAAWMNSEAIPCKAKHAKTMLATGGQRTSKYCSQTRFIKEFLSDTARQLKVPARTPVGWTSNSNVLAVRNAIGQRRDMGTLQFKI